MNPFLEIFLPTPLQAQWDMFTQTKSIHIKFNAIIKPVKRNVIHSVLPSQAHNYYVYPIDDHTARALLIPVTCSAINSMQLCYNNPQASK